MAPRRTGHVRGRVADVAGVPGNPDILYVGAASSGLYKSVNGGVTFDPIFETGNTLSIGAIAVQADKPDVVYVGTGEGAVRNSISFGDGIYKSTDGGRSWKHLGLEKTERFSRLAINPADPQVVIAAALGRAFGPNSERGIFRSSDGGATWQRTLFVNETTGASDVAFDPKDPQIVYAGMYDYLRQPWFFRSGGPGSGLYRSTDGGKTWRKLTDPALKNGLPGARLLGRVGVSVHQQDPRIVYALIEARGTGCAVALSGPGRDVGGREQRTADQQPALLLHAGAQRPGGSEPRLHACGLLQRLDGRRPHIRSDRRPDVRRPSRALDRSDQSEAAALGHRRRLLHFQRLRPELGLREQHADGAGVSRRHRHGRAVQRPWRIPGSRDLARPEREVESGRRARGRLGPSSVYGRRHVHADRSSRSQPDLLQRTLRRHHSAGHAHAGGTLHPAVPARSGRRRRQPREVPLQLELANPHVALEPRRALLRQQCVVQDDRPRRDLDRDQSRSIDQRSREAEDERRSDQYRQHPRGIPLHHHLDRREPSRSLGDLGRHG